MRERIQPNILDRCRGRIHTLPAVVACLALLTVWAVAEAVASGSAVTSEAKPEGGVSSEAGVAPAQATTDSGDSKPEAEPRPKWVCGQQTATAEPVWRGERSLSFAFHIRNEGTADLKINARGG